MSSSTDEDASDDHQEKSKNKLKCEFCKKVYSCRSALVKHLQIHSNNRPTFDCQECGKAMSSRKILAQHVQRHSGAKPFKCNDCGMAFAGKNTLKSHINSFHTPKEFKEMATCPVCEKVLTTNHMYAHMKIHTGEDRHECPQCKKVYLSKKNLKNHLKTHATDRVAFNCEHCGNSFKSVHILRRHMMTHTDTRPTFDCKYCHKKFVSKRGLWDHETIHTGAKPYFCHLCPAKSFRTKQHLQIHTKVIHTGERPFKCGICAKTFLLAGHLKTHMVTHSEDEPFSCPNAPNCPKRFKRKQNSQLHFLNCRATKPIRNQKEDEDESENESPTARRYGGCPQSATRQKPVVPNFTKKECTIVIKRTSYIEKAIRDGYSSFTYCGMNWKRGGKWLITDLIGAGPGRKTKK